MGESPAGKAALVNIFGRLKELKSLASPAGRSAYSKRVQFTIQDVLDARAAGWQKKSFKATAKTKDEIWKEQEQELRAQGNGKGKQKSGCEVVTAGARKEAKDDGEWQTARR